MLIESRIVGFIPVTDTTRAREFYVDRVGLTFEADDGFAVVVRSGETRIRLVHIPGHAPQPYTTLGWEAADVAAEVRALMARGVTFLRVDGMEQDELGIWSPPGGGHVAWFKDPDGNTLSISGQG